MDVDAVVHYWVELAESDWPVVDHLFASGDYNYALFLGHLYLEKLLKALVVSITRRHAPRTHNLLFLAERGGLTVSEERRDVLVRTTATVLRLGIRLNMWNCGSDTRESIVKERLG